MPNESFAKLAQMRKCIDTPQPAQAVYDECISIAGWILRRRASRRLVACGGGSRALLSGKRDSCLRAGMSPTFSRCRAIFRWHFGS